MTRSLYIAENPEETYLKHYGIIGMRWGIRRANSAAKKLSKIRRIQKLKTEKPELFNRKANIHRLSSTLKDLGITAATNAGIGATAAGYATLTGDLYGGIYGAYGASRANKIGFYARAGKRFFVDDKRDVYNNYLTKKASKYTKTLDSIERKALSKEMSERRKAQKGNSAMTVNADRSAQVAKIASQLSNRALN